MARNVITLRPVPAAESCAQVGDTGYAEIAFLQRRRYIALLRLAIGPEPDGARLRVRRSDTEFDRDIDVVVEYEDHNAAASPMPSAASATRRTMAGGIGTSGCGGEHAGRAGRGEPLGPA
jgi:hypothetical protein